MFFKKMIRTMKLYRAQFISMIIMTALGMGMFIGFNMEWYSLEKDVGSFFEKTNFSDYRVVSENGFTKKELNNIKSIDGVKDATRFFNVNMIVSDKDKKLNKDTLALNVCENENVSGFIVTSGEKYNKNSKDGMWISDKYADANKIKKGDEITLKYKNIKVKGKVKGFIKSGEYLICVPDETQLMPNFKKYGFVYMSPKALEKIFGLDNTDAFSVDNIANLLAQTEKKKYTQINIKSDLSKKKIVKEVEKKLGRTELIVDKEDTVSYSESQGEMEEGKTMGLILPVLFLAIAILTMVTTMHRLTASEKRQIGTFKALGFRDGRIIRHYISYAFTIGVLGTVVGIGIGLFVCWYIINPNGMMGTYMDMDDWSLHTPVFVWITLAVVILFMVLIGLYSVKSMLKGTAADALKIYMPKKVRKLFVERFSIWRNLKFGTKWNLRDVFRHKARSFMTLFGIVGCMVILVGALGMQDTLDKFVDTFYEDAIKYNTKINLDVEHTDESDVKNLANKYKGDCSASSSIQVEDKTIASEVYDINYNLVRFVDDNMKQIKLKDNGVYVCERVAKDLSLKKGSTFIFSPYGSSDKYKVKVAGIIRTMSESIAMTNKYADKIDYEYHTNAIFTKAKRVKTNSKIVNTQSKADILESFDTFIAIMKAMVFILAFVAVVLGIVVLYNLGIMSYTERYREMATLKVIGFKDRQIGKLLINQNTWLTVVGVLIGVPAGIGTLVYLINALAAEYEMQLSIRLSTYILSILLTFGVSFIVGLMVSR
nr:FtsX-like permease family protein [Eubacterium sp.]